MSKIAVIIVTFNGENYIEKCLESVLKTDVDFKIFVVDNDSVDQTILLVSKINSIVIIKNNSNLGFGKANNIGIKQAISEGFDQFFLLNQDTTIESHTISTLSRALVENERFGILSPKHFVKNGCSLDDGFKKYYNRAQVACKGLLKVDFVNAAAWMVSRRCFEKVGLFEPIFSHYGEDRNFCDRTKFHEFEIGILENAKIVHDRKIVRNLKKDILQAKYLILCSLININLSVLERRFYGLKQVFGLPKYFVSYYSKAQTLKFFKELFVFYGHYILNIKKISTIIITSKAGKNGL